MEAGFFYTCALLAGGRVKCWGDNGVGQLGLEDEQSRGVSPGQMGDALPFVDLGSGARAVSLTVGRGHACALLEGGQVKCWGANKQSQLGLGDEEHRGDEPGEMGDALPTVDLGTDARVVEVVAYRDHTCALLEQGTVKCWGFNEQGQLGLGDKENRGYKPGQMGDALPAVNLGPGARVVSLATGNAHTCAVLEGGQVKCWGYNGYGQLGLGDTEDRGDEPGEMGEALPVVDLGAGVVATSLAAGNGHTCARLAAGQLKCWGGSSMGSLGLGDTQTRGDQPGEMGDALPFVPLGEGARVAHVSCGQAHACALLDDRQIKCWGANHNGQLGLGDTEDRGEGPGEMGESLPRVNLGTNQEAVTLSLGDEHTCAGLLGGGVKCWGSGFRGPLGVGDEFDRGDEPGEMGDALPEVDLGTSAEP